MTRRLQSSDADLPNSDQKIFEKHMALVLPLRSEMKNAKDAFASVQGSYRAAIKAAENDGINKKSFLEFLKLREQDPEQVTRDMQALNQMLLWGNIPVGAQLGLDLDGKTVASKVDNKAIDGGGAPDGGAQAGGAKVGTDTDEVDLGQNEDELSKIEADGYVAATAGKERDGAGFAQFSDPYRRWCKGYDKKMAERAAEMGKKRGKRSTPTSPENDPPPMAA